MSPVDPVSPTSPMSISPTTPQALQQHFSIPATPILSPALQLPRLITRFPKADLNMDCLKAMAIEFSPLTPSPLKLDQIPLAEVQFEARNLSHKRSDAITSTASITQNGTHSSSSILTYTSKGHKRPEEDAIRQLSPVSQHRMPLLRRQDAMDGLKALATSNGRATAHHVSHLPLRVDTRSSISTPETCTLTPSATAEPSYNWSETTIAPSDSCVPLASDSTTSTSYSILHTQARSRSPIRKPKRSSKSRQCSLSRASDSIQFQECQIQGQYCPLKTTVAHLSSTLQPLISVRTGREHPEFPRSLLQYHLLTHDQLDRLAQHYHQTLNGGRERWDYPCPIGWGKVWCGPVRSESLHDSSLVEKKHLVDLATKRRRWGRFIGLRGCESPVNESTDSDANANGDKSDLVEQDTEALQEQFEREWKEGLRRKQEEYEVQEKIWGRRF